MNHTCPFDLGIREVYKVNIHIIFISAWYCAG